MGPVDKTTLLLETNPVPEMYYSQRVKNSSNNLIKLAFISIRLVMNLLLFLQDDEQRDCHGLGSNLRAVF